MHASLGDGLVEPVHRLGQEAFGLFPLTGIDRPAEALDIRPYSAQDQSVPVTSLDPLSDPLLGARVMGHV